MASGMVYLQNRSQPFFVLLPKGSKRGAHFLGEELRHFERGEVTAAVHLIPVDQSLERLLAPCAGSAIDLAGENGHRDRDLGDVEGIEWPASALRRIPVGARGRCAAVRQPVQR